MVWSIGRVIGGCLVDAKPVLSKDESYVLSLFPYFPIESCLYVMDQIFAFIIS